MAVNIFQVNQINNDLFSAGSNPALAGVYASEYPLYPDNINGNLSRYTKIAGIWPSSMLNSSTGYPAGAGGNSSWAQPNGGPQSGIAARPNGGYFVRAVMTTDQNVPTISNFGSTQYISYGYIGSFVGGYGTLDYTFDTNAGPITSPTQVIAVDYEPPYGHGTVSTIANAPINNTYLNQWRDSNNLTVDATAQVTLTTSAYNRTPYAKPASFVIQMDSATNTITSGTLSFHIEMRPTQLMGGPTLNGQGSTALVQPNGSRAPFRTDQYGYPFGSTPSDFYFMSNNRKFGSRAMSIFWGRIIDGQATAFAYPYYEDQTYATYLQPFPGPHDSNGNAAFADHVFATTAISDCPTSRPPSITNEWYPSTAYTLNYEIVDTLGHVQKVTTAGTSNTTRPNFNITGGTTPDGGGGLVWTDQGFAAGIGSPNYQTDDRIRHTATVHMNDEYDVWVQETKFAIVSNKAGAFPIVFLDLLDTWNSGVWAAGFRIAGATVWSETTAWVTLNPYTIGQAILDPNGYIQVVTTPGTSGGTIPTFNATYNGTTPGDGGVTWTNYGLNKSKIYFISESGHLAVFDSNVTNSSVTALTTAPSLASGAAYGACRILTGSASLYAITGALGINPSVSSTDSTVTPGVGYVGVTPYSIVAGTYGSASFPAFHARQNARSLQEMIKLRNGYLGFAVERVNISGTTITNAGVAPITNVSLTSNVVTITATNNYVTGQQVYLSGLTSATFLNNVQLTILSTGLSSSQFEANYTHANYGTASDTGNATDIEWQVMLFNPSGPTWNTNQITGDATTNFSFSQAGFNSSTNDAYITYEAAFNCMLYDVAQTTSVSGSPVILLQCNWRSDKLYVIDGSTALGTISNSNVTNVSRGSAKDIFTGTTAPANASPLQIRKSVTDDRTMFWFNEETTFLQTNGSNVSTPTIFYVAPPSWLLTNWNQTTVGAVKTVNQNIKDSNGNVSTIGQDLAFLTNVSSQQGTVYADMYSILGTFSDNAVNVVINGAVDSNFGEGEFGITARGNFPGQVYGNNLWQGSFYMPTYFKYSSGSIIMADNYADAVANPIPVPSTAGTNVNLVYGLVAQFGQTGGSSFGQYEWYTVNCTWGNTKFVRKARYVWSMFAGQTFLTTQTTIPLSAVNAVIPTVYLADAFSTVFPTSFNNPGLTGSPSVSAPSGMVTGQDGYNTCAVWPMINGGVAQNNATQVVMTVSHPDPTTILNRPNQSNQVYNASSISSQYALTNAFNGSPWAFSNFSSVVNGVGGQWQANTGVNAWIAIDLGTAGTANSYSFTQGIQIPNQSNNVMSGWTLYGTNSGSAFTAGPSSGWTAIDTRSGVAATRSVAYNVTTPSSYRYYALQCNALSVGSVMAVGFFRLFTSTLQTSINFCEILSFGTFAVSGLSNSSAPYSSAFMRGMTFEVSNNGGSSYTQIVPFWRAVNGGIWCFARQTGVTNIRITCQSGYPYYNISAGGGSWTTSPTANYLGIGPFQFVDYQVSDSNQARLGNSSALDGTPTRGSFDSEYMGLSCDAVSVSIDSTVTPASLGQQFTFSDVYSIGISPVLAWWSFTPIPTGNNATFPNGYVRVHPVYGYVLFGGPQPQTISQAGGSDQIQTMSGTDMSVTYHWGRRV
jgi:hypothetical protein